MPELAAVFPGRPTIARLPAMSHLAIERVRAAEENESLLPQVDLDTQHVLHGGMYARTIRLPPGVRITGALIKIPTVVIVQGDAIVWFGYGSRRLTGYNVLPASAGRKQAFVSISETFITMIFPTNARDVEGAEREFTDEAAKLASRRGDARNHAVITGE